MSIPAGRGTAGASPRPGRGSNRRIDGDEGRRRGGGGNPSVDPAPRRYAMSGLEFLFVQLFRLAHSFDVFFLSFLVFICFLAEISCMCTYVLISGFRLFYADDKYMHFIQRK